MALGQMAFDPKTLNQNFVAAILSVSLQERCLKLFGPSYNFKSGCFGYECKYKQARA